MSISKQQKNAELLSIQVVQNTYDNTPHFKICTQNKSHYTIYSILYTFQFLCTNKIICATITYYLPKIGIFLHTFFVNVQKIL